MNTFIEKLVDHDSIDYHLSSLDQFFLEMLDYSSYLDLKDLYMFLYQTLAAYRAIHNKAKIKDERLEYREKQLREAYKTIQKLKEV